MSSNIIMPPKSDLYFDSMRKKSCLENNEPSFLSLGDKLPSASDWNREHLVAARVIIKDSNKLPQELQNRLKDIRRQGLERNKHASASLFVGDLPQDHRFQGENSLLRADDTPGGLVGHFWSALADLENGLASNMDADDVACSADPDTGRPSRNQQPVSRPGMVSSATTFGSSSPVQPSSQLEPSSDNEAFVDSAIHIKAVAESMTVRLVGSAIRLACFEAGRGLADVVAEYRPTELTLTETMPGAAGQVLTARNDGGIRVRRALARGRGYGNSDGADLVVALLEAKREPLTTLVAGRVAVPDKWLAQMTCEALTACLFAKDHPRRPKSSD